MRFVKLAIISFLFFFVLLFLMSLMVPSNVRISKAINVAKEDSSILNLVRDQNAWPKWHPAFAAGMPTGQAITKVTDSDTLVAFDIQGGAPNPVRNSWALHRFGAQDSLTLQWYMDFKLSLWPWHKFSSLFYEGTYGRMMEQGLSNIKRETAFRKPEYQK